MNVQPLRPDQQDALKEVVNIAMGQAGDALARTLETFINLSTPKIRSVDMAEVIPTVRDMVSGHGMTTAVRQAFFPEPRGEAIVFFFEDHVQELADLMGYEGDLERGERREILLDIANILVGAVLNGITEMLNLRLGFSPPSIIAEARPVEYLLVPEDITCSHALLLEINFSLEDRKFRSHMLIMMAEGAIDQLRGILDAFVESL